MARILLAEDYEDLRELIQELLTKESHSVEAFEDGLAAQQRLNTGHYDLIILDWELPKVYGIDICKQFRKCGGTTPILMLTGRKQISDKEQGFEAGADDYLTKPFHPKELSARVKALLRRNTQTEATPNLVETPESLIGKTLSERYEVLALLGRGSTGLIYKAMHKFLQKMVAVKILYPQLVMDAESMTRFRQEAQAVSTLSHPNIVTVHDFGILPSGLPYIAMDYSEGRTLYDVLHAEDHLEYQRAVPVFLQACSAFSHSHARGVIHRDIKPSNMMLITQTNGLDFLKIVDFGIAKLLSTRQNSPELTQEGQVVGSPLYMSPEQCMGQPLDQRSDIFSLGCVMYSSLIGRDPFVGANIMETMYIRTVEKAPPFSTMRPDIFVPWQIEAIVLKTLSCKPEERQQTMDELKSELFRAAHELNIRTN